MWATSWRTNSLERAQRKRWTRWAADGDRRIGVSANSAGNNPMSFATNFSEDSFHHDNGPWEADAEGIRMGPRKTFRRHHYAE